MNIASVFVLLKDNFLPMGTGLLIFTKNGLINFCKGRRLSSNVSLHFSQRIYAIEFSSV